MVAEQRRFGKDGKGTMRLALGTVAFGLNGYGLPNTDKPKPSMGKVLELLDYAHEHEVEFLDTANAYGDAEETIKIYGAEKFKITSKLKPNCLAGLSNSEILAKVKEELRTDLKRLGLSCLWGYYFHTPEYIYNKKAIAALMECKKEGLVSNIGVSIYEPKDAYYAAKAGIDIIQVPYNILDQRLHKINFFHVAKENGVIIFGRQPFLKELLALPVNKIPSPLKQANVSLRLIDKIVGKYHFTRIEACLLFCLMEDSIDYVVLGVDNIKQLQDNIMLNRFYEASTSMAKAFQPCYAELRESFEHIDSYVIVPSLWKNK